MATTASVVHDLRSLKAILDARGDQALRLQQPKAMTLAANIRCFDSMTDNDAMEIWGATHVLGEYSNIVDDAVQQRLNRTADHDVVSTSAKTQRLENITSFLKESQWARLDPNGSPHVWETTISDALQDLGVYAPHEATVKSAVTLMLWLYKSKGVAITQQKSYELANGFKATFPIRRELVRFCVPGLNVYPKSPTGLPAHVYAHAYADAADPPIFRNIVELSSICAAVTRVRRTGRGVEHPCGSRDNPDESMALQVACRSREPSLQDMVRMLMQREEQAKRRSPRTRGDEDDIDGLPGFRDLRAPRQPSHGAHGECNRRGDAPLDERMSELAPTPRAARRPNVPIVPRKLDLAAGGVVPTLHGSNIVVGQSSPPKPSAAPSYQPLALDDGSEGEGHAFEYVSDIPAPSSGHGTKPSAAYGVHQHDRSEEYENEAFKALLDNKKEREEAANAKRRDEAAAKQNCQGAGAR